ncbi:AAA domain-containing protein [Sphingobacterium sp. LRF_L2]|uniref:AAA domain-containing protein n=1 Tax=Sphingobacterium sp. LRF_L2 TaxID=3369421 RepID=UPI003F62C3AA
MKDYFQQLAGLLDEEHAYDKAEHEALLLKSSLNERRALGVTWFPISVVNSELGRGDYLTITVLKTNNVEEGHKFRFGMPVSLFSNHAPDEDRIDGVIAFVNRDTMRISFRTEELPDWSRRGKLGVDLLFDENSYKEMSDALVFADELSSDEMKGKLIRQLMGEEVIYEREEERVYDNKDLNASQNKAIQHILRGSPLSILHGPPGTGKTTTLVHAVAALLKKEKKQLLLVAPSNLAVDLLTERLEAIGIAVVRIGNPVKVSEHLQKLTLDAKVDVHSANKEVKSLEKQARAYTEMAHKYKRNFGKTEREQRKALFDEARKLRKEIDRIQDFIVEDILDKVQVITATLVGANHHVIRNRHYNTVFIDEAAQALEPACWIPILKADRLVLAGDHCQLPPTVRSSNRPGEGLYDTLFEKLVGHYPEQVSLLDVQYRMHRQIMSYPSQVFYADKLIADTSVSDRTLPRDDEPILFIDTAGAGFEETFVEKAIYNVEEARFVVAHLCSLLLELKTSYEDGHFPSIGVIAPYRGQVLLLREIIASEDTLAPFAYLIRVSTIDGFQGQEKDIIYLSLTRSNSDLQIGFLADTRRMNVAMTRAKKKLIVVGDSSTMGQHPFYKNFLRYVESIDRYRSVWEWNIQV